ncbi:MAG TPA: hypothetical protein VI409_12830 [Gaiellaceae bacterium]|nr:hypothetical protein [Gaiellaceae bacterium]
MAKVRLLVAVVAVALGALTATGAALANEGEPQRGARDHRAACERLESKIRHLRAAIGRLEAMSDMLERKIESGQLTPEQEARAKHALRKIEALQEELGERLERLLEIYGERCRR